MHAQILSLSRFLYVIITLKHVYLSPFRHSRTATEFADLFIFSFCFIRILVQLYIWNGGNFFYTFLKLHSTLINQMFLFMDKSI